MRATDDDAHDAKQCVLIKRHMSSYLVTGTGIIFLHTPDVRRPLTKVKKHIQGVGDVKPTADAYPETSQLTYRSKEKGG